MNDRMAVINCGFEVVSDENCNIFLNFYAGFLGQIVKKDHSEVLRSEWASFCRRVLTKNENKCIRKMVVR